MILQDALISRKSVRAYLDKEVSKETIKKLLNLAKHAPSGVNTQPWKVAVVQGESKQQLQERLLEAFESKHPIQMDYQYYPKEWIAPYSTRRAACGLQLYQALGITKKETLARQKQWAANFRAFDAPVMLFFYMDDSLDTGSFLDYGMFLQSLMLAATAEGLATCAQGAITSYTPLVKAHLSLPKNTILLCGMALGYEDTKAPINQYRTPRIPIDEFVSYYE